MRFTMGSHTAQGTQDVMTYPDIFFTIDNFDDLFESVLVQPPHSVCVELIASIAAVCDGL